MKYELIDNSGKVVGKFIKSQEDNWQPLLYPSGHQIKLSLPYSEPILDYLKELFSGVNTVQEYVISDSELGPKNKFSKPLKIVNVIGNSDVKITTKEIVKGKMDYILKFSLPMNDEFIIELNSGGKYKIPYTVRYPGIEGFDIQYWRLQEKYWLPKQYEAKGCDMLGSMPGTNSWKLSRFQNEVEVVETSTGNVVDVFDVRINKGIKSNYRLWKKEKNMIDLSKEFNLDREIVEQYGAFWKSVCGITESQLDTNNAGEYIFKLYFTDENEEITCYYKDFNLVIRNYNLKEIFESNVVWIINPDNCWEFKWESVSNELPPHLSNISDWGPVGVDKSRMDFRKQYSAYNQAEVMLLKFVEPLIIDEIILKIKSEKTNEIVEIKFEKVDALNVVKSAFDDFSIQSFSQRYIFDIGSDLQNLVDDYFNLKLGLLFNDQKPVETTLKEISLGNFELESIPGNRYSISVLNHPYGNNFTIEKEITVIEYIPVTFDDLNFEIEGYEYGGSGQQAAILRKQLIEFCESFHNRMKSRTNRTEMETFDFKSEFYDEKSFLIRIDEPFQNLKEFIHESPLVAFFTESGKLSIGWIGETNPWVLDIPIGCYYRNAEEITSVIDLPLEVKNRRWKSENNLPIFDERGVAIVYSKGWTKPMTAVYGIPPEWEHVVYYDRFVEIEVA